MTRTQIINNFIEKYNYKNYLEIGVQAGVNFRQVKCKRKVGVDPDKKSYATIKKTSDDFFKDNQEKFDIIFIDGLHLQEQVIRDCINALKFLNEGGTIIWHDCLPTTEKMQVREMHNGAWTGDVWKGWLHFRGFPDLEMYVVDTDYGCGVMKKGTQEEIFIKSDEMTWTNFENNFKEWMNVISVDEFLKRI